MSDWTLILAIDSQHAGELQLTWPTWRANRPEILEHPAIVMLDTSSCGTGTLDLIGLDHPQLLVRPWPLRGMAFPNQRTKMLWSFIAAANYVQTPYYLKVDTDVVAHERVPWFYDWWFRRGFPFIAPKWSYTKPANAIELLDEWADKVGFGEERVDRQFARYGDRVMHKRITSWVFFGQTEWTRRMWSIAAQSPPPVLSHDTFLWFCAARTGSEYLPMSTRTSGWQHVLPSKLKRVTEEIMSSPGLGEDRRLLTE